MSKRSVDFKMEDSAEGCLIESADGRSDPEVLKRYAKIGEVVCDIANHSDDAEIRRKGDGSYRKALRDSQINASDRSWMYVGTSDEEAGLKKLKLVIDSLINIKVYNRDDMVLTRYVGGLRKIAEYNIVQDIGYDESSSMEIVKKLPF